MKITVDMLRRISMSAKPSPAIMGAMVDTLNEYAPAFGLDQPHRMAHYLANVMVESGHMTTLVENLKYSSAQRIYDIFKGPAKNRRFKSVAECQPYVNNPEKLANKVYGNRMGNTKPGDGFLYRGRGPKQITGKDNYSRFSKWAALNFSDAPDFVADPDALLKTPWSVLSTIWFWAENNCNLYADRNDPENLRKAINGGTNGLEDVLAYYDRAALVLLGYGVSELVKFQKSAKVDYKTGSGPITRAALHKALLKKTDSDEQSNDVALSPVVETKEIEVTVNKPVPVKVANLEKPFWKSKEFISTAVAGGGLTGVSQVMSSTGDLPWQNLLILIGSAFVALGIFLWWSRRSDQAEQAVKVAEIKADQ